MMIGIIAWLTICSILYGMVLIVQSVGWGHFLMGLALLITGILLFWFVLRKSE